MTQIPVKIRKVRPHAIIPTYGSEAAACFDLYAAEDVIIAPGETKAVPVGFAVELPDGYELQIRPRSGISLKTKLRVANSPGCVDSDFRGEVAVIIDCLYDSSDNVYTNGRTLFYAKTLSDSAIPTIDGVIDGTYVICRGDRIAQAAVVPIPRVTFVEVDGELTHTERGAGAFGSTGVN
jgi:dUTP pyrophosphatase